MGLGHGSSVTQEHLDRSPTTPDVQLMMLKEMAVLVNRLKSRFSSCLYPEKWHGYMGFVSIMLTGVSIFQHSYQPSCTHTLLQRTQRS